MDNDLRKLFEQLGVDGSGYYMNKEGKIMRYGIIDTFTGVYKDSNGKFKKEGFIFDESLGLFQNSKGEFLNEGFIVDDDTGIYQNEKGDFLKKGLINTHTGFGQNKKGEYKGRFQKPVIPSSNDSDSDTVIKLIIYGVGGCFVLALAFMALYILFLLSPLALLVYYLITKRNNWVWPLLSFSLASFLSYTIFQPSGLLSSGPFRIDHNADSTSYLGMFYVAIAISSVLLYLEKHTLKHFPQDEDYGNFFNRKDQTERRPFFWGSGIILLLITFILFNSGLASSSNMLPGERIDILSGINIRELDNSNSDKIGSLAAGSQVELLERGALEAINNKNDYWYKIRCDNGLEGYIYGSFTSLRQVDLESVETSDSDGNYLNDKNSLAAIDYVELRIYDRWRCVIGDKLIEL